MAPSPCSANFYVLYQDDHLNRAEALAPGKCQLVTQPVKKVPGLDTLVFFGHGVPLSLCEMSAKEVAEKVKRWRASNGKIDTIEILTCNSRHASQGQDPFVVHLRKELGFLLRNLTIKSMPIRMGPGGMHGDSILFADAPSKTWCYVTAPTDWQLTGMKGLFNAIADGMGDDAIRAATYLTTPPPKTAQEGLPSNPFKQYGKEIKDLHDNRNVQAMMFKFDSYLIFKNAFLGALKDDAFRREFIATRKYSMNYGTFTTLRHQLVAIKS